MGSISEAVMRWFRTSPEPGDVAAVHPLRLLAREGGGRALRLGIAKIVRSGGLVHCKSALLALQAEILWTHGDHAGVRRTAELLVSRHKSALGHFYLAQSAFVHGEFEAAAASLQRLLALDPNHTDGIYLRSACALETGDRELAWSVLEDIALRDSRPKTWLHLAQLVRDKNDFGRLMACHARARENKTVPAFSKDIQDHLALGALRGGEYEQAKEIWRGIILHIFAKPARFGKRARKKADYSAGRAECALLDLRRTLEAARIEMFLVSGTLLGCIREGRLLSHDKDIDVGIWEDVPPGDVRAALRASGLFFLIPSRAPEILRVRHVNGIPLDLFYHYRQQGDYWHGGVKNKWHNSPFDLVPRTFLGESFLVPADHDRYLTENYGDWRAPKTDFDSAFDTPNGEVIHADEQLVHCFKMLLASYLKGASGKVDYYLGKLDAMGEKPLAARCGELLASRAQ